MEQIELLFFNSTNGAEVLMKFRLVPDSDLVQLDVNMGGIPLSNQGQEVVVSIYSYDIQNYNSTFYTDSNGLEMQKRILNHRDTYNLVTD